MINLHIIYGQIYYKNIKIHKHLKILNITRIILCVQTISIKEELFLNCLMKKKKKYISPGK